MAAKQEPKRWTVQNLQTVATFLQLNPRQVDRLVADGLPRRKVGPNRYEYDLDKIARWYIRRGQEMNEAAMLTSDNQSEALEEYRRQRARSARVEADNAEASAVHLDLIRAILDRFKECHEPALDRIEAMDKDAAEIIRTSVADACNVIEEFLERP